MFKGIIVKKITSVLKLACIGFALVAGVAVAQPVVWTVPTTTLNGGSTISGTVTYDETTSSLTAINITSTGTNAGAFTFASNAYSSNVKMGQLTASGTSGDTVIYFFPNFPSTPGATSSTSFGFATCYTFTSGLCTSASSIENGVVSFSLPAADPMPIPTLGQWGMIFLASLMGLFGFARIRRQS
jgi:hypothetical protein